MSNQELREKILEGSKLALKRLIEKKEKDDGYLVFSENEKVVKIKAKDMQRYKNLNSGVDAYELGPDYIITRFGDYYYLYSNKVTGADKVKQMMKLAIKGEGLSSFISKLVKKNYE